MQTMTDMMAFQLLDLADGQVQSVPIPVIREHEVLIRVHSCGICGSDIPRYFETGAHNMPITLGHELSGTVVEVGSNKTDLQVGSRVTVAPLIPCYQCFYCTSGLYSLCDKYSYLGSRQDGAFAEYVRVPMDNCIVIPNNVSLEEAALTDPAANALHALWKGRIVAGETVLVFGVGAIGLFAVQWAKYLGAEVIVVDRYPEKIELAKKLGAKEGFVSADQDVLKEIRDMTGHKQGVDLAVELSGSLVGQRFNMAAVRKQGRVVLHGISHKHLLIPEGEFDSFQRGERELIGSWNSFSSPFPGREWTETVKALSTGELLAEPIISRRCKLPELRGIFEEYHSGRHPYNKVLCQPNI